MNDVKKPPRRQLRGTVLVACIGLAAALAALAILLAHEPSFYRRGMGPAAATAEGEARARRMVTKASTLYAAVAQPASLVAGGQPGSWEAAIRDDELNAWLAIDLPRSHPSWLPRGVTAPRVAFRERHASAAARVGYGPLSAVASVDLEIALRDVNQLGIVVEQAKLGAIPLPSAPIARGLARRLHGLGIMTELRQRDGRLGIVVHFPRTSAAGAAAPRVETLSLIEGELLMAGTLQAAGPARPGGPDPPR